ncbi:hypothetical protein F5877DRAFT_6916, partial [Lentinula edodes]
MLGSTSGYLGSERVDPSRRESTWSLDQMVGEGSTHGFRLIRVDPSNPCVSYRPMPLVNDDDLVYGVVVPPPKGADGKVDPSFMEAAGLAAKQLDEVRPDLFKSGRKNLTDEDHRRGQFPVKAVGISFGGGQERPKRIYHAA